MDLRRFYPTPTKSGINIEEWSMLKRCCFRFSICLRIIELRHYYCMRLDMKNGANFEFFGPVRFREHVALI